MGEISSRFFIRTLAASFLGFLFVLGCSQTPRTPEGVLDTPVHHVSSGFKFLQKDYNADAQREFELALQLDPYYSAAHRGLGLVYAKENKFESAFDAMRKARDDASSGEQKAMAYVGFMRLYTMQKKCWMAGTGRKSALRMRYNGKAIFPRPIFIWESPISKQIDSLTRRAHSTRCSNSTRVW